VAEWCLDWFVEDFYRTPDAKKKNPVATEPVSPKKRSIRGGSWVDGPLKIRCSARRGYFPSYFLKGAYKVLGFRCVLNPEK
jgi:formylglycine-generating enzyme required for sulfatase activity